ncbi:hypothetical protein [Virgibacillus oceani]|uniref:Uncharacterized protein n=1 Tax=Virgibacillus oceani TaxID=1479511 RepID=A0A917HRE5_9BACI|nr:hypothetical protein [Virgibacillus oceani]GGG87940.1 hypothetical protein GCM10011398_37350 [Virgibacillus oceani]
MNENIVAKILFIIGVAQMVVGFLLGIILANADYFYDGFVWSTFLAWTIGGFVSGMLFIGFSEVIKLLNAINGKMTPLEAAGDKKTNNYLDIFNGVEIKPASVNWTLAEQDQEKIYELYANENIAEVIPSILEGYCIVKLKDAQEQFVRVVDVGGFSAEEVHDKEIKHRVISWYNHA